MPTNHLTKKSPNPWTKPTRWTIKFGKRLTQLSTRPNSTRSKSKSKMKRPTLLKPSKKWTSSKRKSMLTLMSSWRRPKPSNLRLKRSKKCLRSSRRSTSIYNTNMRNSSISFKRRLRMKLSLRPLNRSKCRPNKKPKPRNLRMRKNLSWRRSGSKLKPMPRSSMSLRWNIRPNKKRKRRSCERILLKRRLRSKLRRSLKPRLMLVKELSS